MAEPHLPMDNVNLPETTLPSEEPLLVVRLAPEIAVVPPHRRPRPGLLEAVLWCLLFLLTQITAALGVTALILAVFAWRHEQPGEFVDQQLAGLAQATQGSSELVAESAEAPASVKLVRPTEVPREISLALIYGMLAAQLASWGLIRLTVPRVIGGDWKEQIGFRPLRFAQLLLLLLALFPFMILAGAVQEVIRAVIGGGQFTIAQTLQSIFGHAPLVITLAAVAVGPGIVEEVWCRGFLGRGLVARYGTVQGVLWTSLLFGFLHIDPAYALVAAAMGAYLHFVYFACRSIVASITLHALNNAVVFIATLYPAWLPLLGADAPALSATSYALAALALAAVSYGLWRTRPT